VTGIVVATAGILASRFTGMPEFDGAASIVVGGLLCSVAVLLARESRPLLIGESADPALVHSVRRATERDPAVKRVADLLTMQLGPRDVLLNLALEFHPRLTSAEVRAASQRLHGTLTRLHPELSRLFVTAVAGEGRRLRVAGVERRRRVAGSGSRA
jgi:divalent metal cation (Fe/Co/Zn/Cd) transporter